MTDLQFGPRGDKQQIEEGNSLAPRFGPDGLMPVAVSDATTGAPLMLAYMNAEALKLTVETGQAHYFSRSRQEIWHKGATSGQFQHVREILIDCDQDSLWLRVEQQGSGCCHTGRPSCYYRRVAEDGLTFKSETAS